jgi:DNA-binding winged helix-turn-helix (wHTH) protein
VYRFGGFILDTAARRLHRGNHAIHLTPKAFELLGILIEERPRAMSKEELQDRLWPDTYVVDANLPVLIREIRSAIGDDERSAIRTVQRFGYAFAGELSSTSTHMLTRGDREFLLRPGENIVGRDASSDVSIVSSTVSRQHAKITIRGDDATIVDLKSKNGTRVAGREAVEPIRLFDGVAIQIGRVEMIYRCPSAQSETQTAHLNQP